MKEIMFILRQVIPASIGLVCCTLTTILIGVSILNSLQNDHQIERQLIYMLIATIYGAGCAIKQLTTVVDILDE